MVCNLITKIDFYPVVTVPCFLILYEFKGHHFFVFLFQYPFLGPVTTRMAGFFNSGCSQCQTSSFYLVSDIYELDINGLGKCTLAWVYLPGLCHCNIAPSKCNKISITPLIWKNLEEMEAVLEMSGLIYKKVHSQVQSHVLEA